MTARETTIPIQQAAVLLMISDHRIQQLQRQGFIPHGEEHGRVPLVGAIQGYLRFLQDPDRRAAKVAAESRVNDAKVRQIESRMSRVEQDLVPAREATALLQIVVDTTLDRLSKLPARFTKDREERRRLKASIDGIRSEVAVFMSEHRPAYRELPDGAG